MAEPKTLTLKHLRELAKKHLVPGYTKLKTKTELVAALKKIAPNLFAAAATAKASVKATTKAATAPKAAAASKTKDPAAKSTSSKGAGAKTSAAKASAPKAAASKGTRASPAKIIKFKSTRKAAGEAAAHPGEEAEGGGKKRLVAVSRETIAEPVVEGFFVARMAGEGEAQRHRMTEDQARPIRQVRAHNLYDEKLGELPSAYEDDALVLLPRDPHTLFLYWDFHPETKRAAREGLKDPKTIIRLFDRGTLVREVDFALESRSFYLHSLAAGRRYHAELYYIGANGQARRMGRPSNSIELPPDGVSNDTSVKFLRIPWGFPLSRLKELGQQGVATYEVPPVERRYRVWRRIPLPGSDSLIVTEDFVERTSGERHVASERLMPDARGHFTGSSEHFIPGSSDHLVRGPHKAGEER